MSQSKQSRERGGKRTARGSPSGFDLSALRPLQKLPNNHAEDRGDLRDQEQAYLPAAWPIMVNERLSAAPFRHMRADARIAADPIC